MSLYKDWTDLIEGQTDKTFDEFWEKYSSTEQRIYQGILKDKQAEVSGVFKEKAGQGAQALCAARPCREESRSRADRQAGQGEKYGQGD